MEFPKNPTLQDVAKKIGFSTATVSRVVNNNPSVTPDIREKVKTALKEMNYKKLKKNKTEVSEGSLIIGLIIPDILNPFFPLLIKGIENIAKIHGYSIILCDSENDIETEKKHVENLLKKDIEGLIFVPAPGTNRLINKLIDNDFPLVFLDRKIENEKINFVTSANEEGAYQAIKYLLRLGHINISYLAGPKYLSTEKERFQGFKNAMEEAHIKVNDRLILQCDHSWESGYKNVTDLITSG